MASSGCEPRALSGAVIGGYRLQDPIGDWGDGVVYRGRRVSAASTLPEVATIEVLSTPGGLDLRQEQALLDRFQRRMDALSRLHHPQIAPVLAWGADESQPFALLLFVVLPHLLGQTLADRLAKGPLPLADAASLTEQVAASLDGAHAANVAHGAVAPSRVLLESGGRACLMGFAIDVVPEALPPVRATGGPAANPADGTVATACAADIRALAGVLYEMVTGRSPFVSGGARGESLRVAEPLTLLRRLRPDLPAAAEAAIVRGLAVESGQAFASAGELATTFAAGLDIQRTRAQPAAGAFVPATLEHQPTVPMMAVAPERPTAPLVTIPTGTGQLIWARRPRRRWLAAALVAVVVLFVLMLALIFGLGSARTPGTPAHASVLGALQSIW